MHRTFLLLYATIAYVLFLAVFVYLIAFVGGFIVPTTVDAPASSLPLFQAVAINLLLILTFGIAHSLFARPAFKRWLTQWLPTAAERSTYVLQASLLLALLMWQWQPIAGTAWSVDTPALRLLLWVVFWLGWAVLLLSTFLINHFELFGLQQAWQPDRNRLAKFVTPLLYRFVRHPMMLGMLLALWATPTMSASHLLFTAGLSIYIVIGTFFEERDLVATFGHQYLRYQQTTPQLLPIGRRRQSQQHLENLT